jgi:hypothetical protein
MEQRRLVQLAAVIGVAVFGDMTSTACVSVPREKWSATSANGRYELSAEPGAFNEAQERYEESSYRLERVGKTRRVVWTASSAEFYMTGLVANDGDYVVLSRAWYGNASIAIRNSAGALIREFQEEDLLSIAEGLDGLHLEVQGFDEGEELLLTELTSYDADPTLRVRGERRIQLMDGAILEPLKEAALPLPVLPCSGKSFREAERGTLTLTCWGEDTGERAGREFSLADGAFSLRWAADFRRGTGREWHLNQEGESCEEIYLDGDIVSERCGADVLPPPI